LNKQAERKLRTDGKDYTYLHLKAGMEGGFSKITSRGETVEKVPKQILG